MTTTLPGNFGERLRSRTNKLEKKADTEAVATVILKLPPGGVRLPRRFAPRKDYFIQPFTTVIGSPLRSDGGYPAGENDLPRLTEQDYRREKVSCTLDN